MRDLVQALVTKDLLAVRDSLATTTASRHPGHVGTVLPSCTLVCAMWSAVIATCPNLSDDAPSIATCMLTDSLHLIEDR